MRAARVRGRDRCSSAFIGDHYFCISGKRALQNRARKRAPNRRCYSQTKTDRLPHAFLRCWLAEQSFNIGSKNFLADLADIRLGDPPLPVNQKRSRQILNFTG